MEERSIQLRHPLPYDPVGRSFHLAGLGSGHEADLYFRLRNSTGDVMAEGRFRGGPYSLQDFHHVVELPPELSPSDDRATLEVFWESPADPEEDPSGPEKDTASTPLVLAFTFMPNFVGWYPQTVQPGDTLTGIAQASHSQDVTADHIFRCNQDLLDDPDVIHPGQVLRIPSEI